MWDNWEDVWGWDLSMRGPPLCFRIGQRKKPRWIVPGPQGLHAQRVWSNRYACFSFHSLHSRHDMSWQCSIWTTITTTREIHRRQPRLSDLSGIGAWLLNTGSFGHRKRSWPSKGPRMAQNGPEFWWFFLGKIDTCLCLQTANKCRLQACQTYPNFVQCGRCFSIVWSIILSPTRSISHRQSFTWSYFRCSQKCTAFALPRPRSCLLGAVSLQVFELPMQTTVVAMILLKQVCATHETTIPSFAAFLDLNNAKTNRRLERM